MTVTVLFFASYADAFGRPSMALDLAPGTTVTDLVRELAGRAGGERLPPRPLVAVNAEYAEPSRALAPGDEVAIIPPVAGG